MKVFLASVITLLPFGVDASAKEPAAPAKEAPAAKGAVKNVTAEEAEKLIAENPGLIVLDVRTPEEFEHQHIKGAVNVNVHDPEFDKQIAALDQTKPVLVHCQAGGRSKQALEEMEGKVKFPQIYHMNSGFAGWKKANKPMEVKPLPGAGRLAPGTKAPATEATPAKEAK